MIGRVNNIMSNSGIIVTLLICLIQNGSAVSRIDPLVDSKVGLIRGLRATDGAYSMFMGIPYATVNETNPFGPSIPYPGFDDTFEAYDDTAICPQVEEFNNTIVGSLDCLHLNIYVPDSANFRNPLPVLVWIHGGGFTYGFAGRYLYGPRYLVNQDIILITLNYRLGPYGFMCLDIPDVPGNQGLKDQQIALRWIKNNIEAFGGNSNKITAIGESAGGISVDYHLIYGKEKIFDKVIIQSGVALGLLALSEPDLLTPIKLAEYLGFPTSDVNEALEFVTKTDTTLVIAATIEQNLVFRPCVEKDFNGVETFIHDYPVNAKIKNLDKIPVLIGHNSDEMLPVYHSKKDFTKNIFYENLDKYFNFTSEELVEMEAEIRQFYIGDENLSPEIVKGLIEFESDLFFNYPTIRTIDKYLQNGAKNIYYYLFFYDGARNFVKDKNNITAAGVAHADELSYLFDVSYMDVSSPEDQLVVDRVTTLWANFVKYGNPTPAVSDLLPVQWSKATKEILYYLNIDSELKVEKRSFNARMAMWHLFYKLNAKYQVGYRGNDE